MTKTALFCAVLTLACAVQAATVTTTADSGNGSLRAAIAAAVPGETINFTVSGTITLTTGELLVNKNLTVSGPGAANLTIERSAASGTADFRLFNIDSGIVTLSGLTIRNGRADEGAGINNQTTLTVRDCVVLGNTATSRGGGIRNLSTLVCSNCTVVNNAVLASTNDSLGGGIQNEGTLTLTRSVVANNLALAGLASTALGGGIHNSGTLSITNSVLQNNSASAGEGVTAVGGGIFNTGTLDINTTTVDSNSVTNGHLPGLTRDGGGGIANDLGTIKLDRSTVSSNIVVGGTLVAATGAGISTRLGTLIVESSTVSGNRILKGSPDDIALGGAIYNTQGSVSLSHTTISQNSPGGIVNSEGLVEIKNAILAGNFDSFDLVNVNGGDTLSSGFNLFGSLELPITPGTNDQFNLTAVALRLGPLAANGGPTATHALLCGSPAIDAGDNTDAPATDQRGMPRIINGVIDIGSFESSNNPPTITCPDALTICSASNSALVSLSVEVKDTDGDRLTVVWRVDGLPLQTNQVPAGALPPTTASVAFAALLTVGPHEITASVIDSAACEASCSTSVAVSSRGDLYPIALSQASLSGIAVGGVINDIYNGVQPGNFGWLTWAGSPNEPTLVTSLTPRGNSSNYVNPRNHNDHTVSVGDWVQGKPGVSNSDKVRKALDTLETIDIVVPVWNQAISRGNNSLYRVSAFARVRLLSYKLPNQNRITARFLGFVDCP